MGKDTFMLAEKLAEERVVASPVLDLGKLQDLLPNVAWNRVGRFTATIAMS